MTRKNAKVPVYDAEYIEPTQRPRFVDARPFALLILVAIAALFVAVLLIVGRVV